MAARKSCTHLTWAEAKSKVGGGSGSKGGSNKKNNPPKNVPHNQILAQKIIAKQQSNGDNDGNGGSGGEKLVGKKSLRKQQREDEKASLALAAEKKQRELERKNRTIKPYEQSIKRCKEIAIELQSKWKYSNSNTSTTTTTTANNIDIDIDIDTMKQMGENIGMQLDEIMALEAIFADTTEFMICDATNIDKLRQLHESYVDDEDNETILQNLIRHLQQQEGSSSSSSSSEGGGGGGAPISFTIQLNIPDENGIINNSSTSITTVDDDEEKNIDVAALVVLHVVLPPSYPNNNNSDESSPQPIIIDIYDCMVTDKNAQCSPDKPLETIAFLDKASLQNAMSEEISTILPYPCIYEVGVTWLTENIFNYLELRTHHVV